LKLYHLAILFILSTRVVSAAAQYRVLPGREDVNGFPTAPASICLSYAGTAHCYTSPDYMKDSPFGLDPKAQTIGKLNGQDLTLFTATYSGGGSGTLTNFALLTVKDGDFVNLLPKVQLTNQSEYKIWHLPQISDQPILITADFVWDFKAMEASNYKEDTHLAHHRYTVRAFVFDAASGRYLERIRYITTRKYPGLDDADAIRVLNVEKPTILSKLQQQN
jgi:hypothetical protein